MQDLCIERFSFAQDRKIMRLAIMELQRFKVFFELRCSIMFDLSSPVHPCFPGSSCKGFFPTELLPNFNFLLHLHNIYYFFYITYIIYIHIINPLH